MKKRKKNKSKDANFFSLNYKKTWSFIKESKKFIWVVIAVFVFSLLLGIFFQPTEISKIILDYIEKVVEETQDMSSLEMISFIFLNNLRVGFMGIIYGFLFGIPPVLFAFGNGYVVGFVSSLAVSSSGAVSLLSLLPHGIFELPAIFISFGMGIKLGSFIFYKDKLNKFVYFFKESLRVFLFVIVPLLIIAAVIEGILIFVFN